MTHRIENGSTKDTDIALKQEFMRRLGQYQIVQIDANTIGITDPDDLIDGEEPRLLASLDLREGRGLNELFAILIGPAMYMAGNRRDFLVGDTELLDQLRNLGQ